MTSNGASPMPDPPIVDAHAHIFERGLPLSADAWMAPDYDFTAQDYLAQLDSHGIHFGVLSALSISGFYNDYTIAAAGRDGRLRATAIVPPESDRSTLAQMRDDGVVGIRLQLARATVLPDLRDEAHQRLLRRVRDLDWHVHVAIEGQRLPPVLAALEEGGRQDRDRSFRTSRAGGGNALQGLRGDDRRGRPRQYLGEAVRRIPVARYGKLARSEPGCLAIRGRDGRRAARRKWAPIGCSGAATARSWAMKAA